MPRPGFRSCPSCHVEVPVARKRCVCGCVLRASETRQKTADTSDRVDSISLNLRPMLLKSPARRRRNPLVTERFQAPPGPLEPSPAHQPSPSAQYNSMDANPSLNMPAFSPDTTSPFVLPATSDNFLSYKTQIQVHEGYLKCVASNQRGAGCFAVVGYDDSNGSFVCQVSCYCLNIYLSLLFVSSLLSHVTSSLALQMDKSVHVVVAPMEFKTDEGTEIKPACLCNCSEMQSTTSILMGSDSRLTFFSGTARLFLFTLMSSWSVITNFLTHCSAV